jgi:hypothetical protein
MKSLWVPEDKTQLGRTRHENIYEDRNIFLGYNVSGLWMK